MFARSNVVACAKHFVGDGGTTQGVDESNTVSSYKQLVNIHRTPYFDAIAKGVSTIMVSYSSWNGQKMHANRFLISHVLKKQLRFQVLLLFVYRILIGFGFFLFQKITFCKTFNQFFSFNFTMMPSCIGYRALLFQIGKVLTR